MLSSATAAPPSTSSTLPFLPNYQKVTSPPPLAEPTRTIVNSPPGMAETWRVLWIPTIFPLRCVTCKQRSVTMATTRKMRIRRNEAVAVVLVVALPSSIEVRRTLIRAFPAV
uniref:Uncharacterized protein n=1 Tax=Cacopsylla melanoneura TaxID=428564 RepID=A0A8D8UJF7_9HEMI